MFEVSGKMVVPEATVMLALQEYLDRRLAESVKKPKVVGVAQQNGLSGMFEVTVQGTNDAPKPG